MILLTPWFLFVLGIHSCVIASAMSIMVWRMADSGDVVEEQMSMGICPSLALELCIITVCEATSAFAFQLLHNSTSENERLLNDSTASCVVHRFSGCIESCSFQAASLLGTNAIGGCIFDAVRSEDQASIRSFCREGIDGPLPGPILVTLTYKRSWNSPSIGEFDAKILQYSMAQSDDVRLLIELTGEVRL